MRRGNTRRIAADNIASCSPSVWSIHWVCIGQPCLPVHSSVLAKNLHGAGCSFEMQPAVGFQSHPVTMFLQTSLWFWLHTQTHTYMYTSLHTWIRTYIHSYIYTYVHTYTDVVVFNPNTLSRIRKLWWRNPKALIKESERSSRESESSDEGIRKI